MGLQVERSVRSGKRAELSRRQMSGCLSVCCTSGEQLSKAGGGYA